MGTDDKWRCAWAKRWRCVRRPERECGHRVAHRDCHGRWRACPYLEAKNDVRCERVQPRIGPVSRKQSPGCRACARYSKALSALAQTCWHESSRLSIDRSEAAARQAMRNLRTAHAEAARALEAKP